MNKEDLKIGDYVYYGDNDCYIIGKIYDYDDNTGVIWIDGYYVHELPKNINEYNKLIKDNNGLLCWNFMISVKKLFSKTQSNNKIEFENGSIIQTIKSNEAVKGKGFINSLNNMYNELEDKNFKVGEYVYAKNVNNYYNYLIGKITYISEYNEIEITGYTCEKLPKNKIEYNEVIGKHQCTFDFYANELYKLTFKEDIEKQEIVDKMKVLLAEIDIALGFKNKKAFDSYVQEYKKLEQELNKSEVLI